MKSLHLIFPSNRHTMPTITYNPDSMPDLSGKVILITGGEYNTTNQPESPDTFIQSLHIMDQRANVGPRYVLC